MKYKTRIHTLAGSSFIVELDSNFKLAPNFATYEFVNKLATDEIKFEIWPESLDLLRLLQFLRDKYGVMKINSGYRTKKYNASLPDANPKSAHLHFGAGDWETKFVNIKAKREEIANDCKTWCETNGIIGAIGFYPWGLHIEVHSDKWYSLKTFTIWNYL